VKILPKTRQALRRCVELTEPICARCPGNELAPQRCCSEAYCEVAAAGMAMLGLLEPARPGYLGVPFLSQERGCVLEPEHRPVCATYLCASSEKLTDSQKDVLEKVNRLRRRVFADELVIAMGSAIPTDPKKRALVEAAVMLGRAISEGVDVERKLMSDC